MCLNRKNITSYESATLTSAKACLSASEFRTILETKSSCSEKTCVGNLVIGQVVLRTTCDEGEVVGVDIHIALIVAS